MTKRPLCFLCFLMVLGLGIMNFAGIPLLGGNPLPVTVQDWIEAHPGSVICGEVEQYENTEFSQSVYLKKTYLIYQSKKFSIENVRVFLKKEEDLKPGMKILVKGTLKRVEEPSNPGGFDSQHYYACRHIYYFMKNAVVRKKTESYSGYRQQLFKVNAGRFLRNRQEKTRHFSALWCLGTNRIWIRKCGCDISWPGLYIFLPSAGFTSAFWEWGFITF